MRDHLYQNRRMEKNSGFTLVELIVVLAIISILSTAAVFSVIGYIDRSRFNKNEQNAASIFQAVQTALGREKISGELEGWVRDTLLVKGTEDPYSVQNHDADADGNALDACYDAIAFENFNESRNKIDDSVHMRYALTYEKGGSGGQNEVIRDFVGSYFYDTTLLDATFTIEFDVEKMIGTDAQVHYSANVYSVFYDERRVGWDEKARNNAADGVPYRSVAYREDTSLVGYYNGSNPSAIDSVYTPAVNNKIEFAELSLRNGETLDLTFSAVNGAEQVTGTGQYSVHYTASIYDAYEEEKIADLVISEAALMTGTPKGAKPEDFVSNLRFDPDTQEITDGKTSVVSVGGKSYPVLYTVDRMQDDADREFTRYKASIRSTALVYVHKGKEDFEYNDLAFSELSAETKFYRFPLTVSYVIRKYDHGKQEYVSYSIALDAMMARGIGNTYEKNVRNSAIVRLNSSSITRLFEDEDIVNDVKDQRLDAQVPKNIYVSMTASVDAFKDEALAQYNELQILPASVATKAKRAYDDTVYRLANGNYAYKESAALGDAAGYAVVNTFFGDLDTGSFGNKYENGAAACITSLRHLYNMRYTASLPQEATYSILRDLNWYEKIEDKYASDVVVYDANMAGHSPVGENRKYAAASELVLVSWPALPSLTKNQTLLAAENDISTAADDKTAVIRNVQMRRESFLSTDEGYGLICRNNGLISNIRGENFCLTLESVADGTSETKSVAATLKRLYEHGNDKNDSIQNRDGCKLQDGKDIKPAPVGALVGLQDGVLGEEGKTIRMSNPIVLAGIWKDNEWKKVRLYVDGASDLTMVSGIGGVAGYYSAAASSAGEIITDGKIAVAGAYYVGGVLGKVNGGVDAHLIVDSSKETAESAVSFPDAVGGLVMGRKFIGGAVGYLVNGYFAQEVPAAKAGITSDAEGVVTITEKTDAAYGIEATLAANTYVWQYGGYGTEAYEGVGGAVGQIYHYDAEKVLSIKCSNAGFILGSNNANGRYVGGVVGCLQQGAAKEMYIFAQNAETGLIGTRDGSSAFGKSLCAAAGVACIRDFGTGTDAYVFHVSNKGVICCNTDKKSREAGVGTAIGAFLTTTGSPVYPSLLVRAENAGKIIAEDIVDNQTNADHWNSKSEYLYGVGGAAGYLYGLQNDSHIYSQLAASAEITANGNNVGGAVGCLRGEVKGTGDKQVTVTAELNGNAVVQSKGGINVGGCTGDLWSQSDYSVFRTQILGDAKVYGYRNVGGVVGRGQQMGRGTGQISDAKIILQGASEPYTLTLTGAEGSGNINKDNNTNVGGVIGVAAAYGGVYSTELISPDQSTEKLIMHIDGAKNVGGMAGSFLLHDLRGAGQHNGTAAMEYTVVLNQATTINGIEQSAGGAIGYIYDDGDASDFAAAVRLAIPAGGTSPMIQGNKYIGGAIGYVLAPKMTGKIDSTILGAGAVSGKGIVGGAIGYASISGKAGEVHSLIKASAAVTATGSISQESPSGAYVGGCIGLMDGEGVYDAVYAQIDGGETGELLPIQGASHYMGGCIGCIGNNNQGAVVQNVLLEVKKTGKLITAPEASLTGIGGVVGWVRNKSRVDKISVSGDGITLDVPKGSSVGGMVGQVTENSSVMYMTGSVPININAYNSVGGYIGLLKDSKAGKFELTDAAVSADTDADTIPAANTVYATLAVAGNKYVGGCIGEVYNGNVGIAGETCQISGVQSVEAAEIGNNRGAVATGGFAGIVYKGSVVNSSIDMVLGQNSYVRGGGWNTGGVFGQVNESTLSGNYSVHFQGGQVLGNYGHRGGVIGYIRKSKADGVLSTWIEAGYSTTDEAGTVLGGDTTADEIKSIGGVIGHIGDYNNRKDEVSIGTLELHLGADLYILSGYSSLGGVIGQCESEMANIGNIKITSTDGKKHRISILPDVTVRRCWDLGGVIGYMMGNLTGTITTENTEFVVAGWDYLGGWIGCLDGKLGSTTFNVKNIVSVTGSKGNVGGVIGVTGGNHIPAKISSNFIVDLTDAEITGYGENVGGVIGATGVVYSSEKIYGYIQANLTNVKITSSSSNVGGVIGKAGTVIGGEGGETGLYSNITVTASNTVISGRESVGGILGFIKSGGNVDNESTYRLSVTDDTTITAFGNGHVGGIAGNNEAEFFAKTEVKVESGTILTVLSEGGCAGGIMGKNGNQFGRPGSDSCKLPEGGGRIRIEGKNAGYVLGYNGSSNGNRGECGIVGGSGTLVYNIGNAELEGDRVKREPITGYVGKNDYEKKEYEGEGYRIHGVEINTSGSGD